MKPRITAALIVSLSLTTANAQGQNVDWKMFGVATSGDICFYDAEGASRTSNNRVRVWTKCIHQIDLDRIDIKKDFDGKIVDRTARKVMEHYIPPIATIEDSTFDQGMAIIQYEVTANIGSLEPTARIFYELNCPEQALRELSIWIRDKGSSDRERPWTYASPETNGWRLVRLLCPVR